MSSQSSHVVVGPSAVDGVHPGTAELIRLRDDVRGLLHDLADAETSWAPWLTAVTAEHRDSARNVVHYWAIRQHDLRGLQSRLAAHGLSSLGRSEPHVQAALLTVQAAIGAMLGRGWEPPGPSAVRFGEGELLLRHNAVDLLGPSPVDRATRIMVTLPSTAATDPELVRHLVARGMDIARINCAHDDADAWRAMARHVRDAAQEAGRSCLVAMDLAGPKLRTGPIEPGPRRLKLRPRRDALGRVLAPARVWLTTAEDPSDPPEPGMPTLPLPREWLGRRSTGDVVHLRDARGAARRLLLTESDATGGRCDFVGTVEKTTYLATGLPLHVAGDVVAVPDLPAVSQALVLGRGDTLELTKDCAPAPVETGGGARIGATLPELFDDARVGDPILFDDGKLGGEIVAVTDDVLTVRIDQPARGTVKLREAKGINVPETPLQVSALTAKDVVDLRTVADVADVVELSFVRSADDVERLLAELDRLGDDRLGVVLKIETRQAFENLPQLLLAAMRRARVGVMVARGDLAVECGFERMAELQEEILWLCEAAHLPVVWATQVLEQCVKTGLPSRAEISDAAMSERAECVMLNKGPFVDDAVSVLDDVLRRMAAHHYKKTVLLRSLRSWHTPGPTVG